MFAACSVPAVVLAQDIGLSGTMIVFFPTSHAIAVCADKRQTSDRGAFSDKDTKITIVDRNRGFASSGTTRFVGNDGHITFDADTIAQNTIMNVPAIDRDWSLLGEALVHGLQSYVLSKPSGSRPATKYDDFGKPVLLAVTVFFFDESGVPRLLRFPVEYENLLPTPAIRVSPEDKSGKIVFDGGYRLPQRIIDPTTDVSAMPDAVKRVVIRIRTEKAFETPLNEAIEFARWVISEASKTERGISATNDCVTLTHDQGIRKVE